MGVARAKFKDELVFWAAAELASAIRDRELSATEVLEAHLDHISRHNAALHAIATLNEEEARRRAREADDAIARGKIWGPLHGVPVTIKDIFETANLRTTSSHRPLANHIPTQDSGVAAKLRAAGAIILAKTNCAELAGDLQVNSPLFGRANNPWDLNRTTGGSSGGGAAAVAAGLSPLDFGSDSAGSIRHPAHFCGVFGFCPTKMMVSGAGRIPPLPGDPTAGWRSYGSFGPLARSVEDLRLGIKAIAGPDLRDWKVPPVPLTEPPQKPLSEMRFAWSDDFGGIPITSDTRAALEKLAGTLEGMGCRVERRNPPDFDFVKAWQTFGYIAGVEYGVQPAPFWRMMGRVFALLSRSPIAPLYYKGDIFSRHGVIGRELSMRKYFIALTTRDSFVESLERFLSDYDAWLCPVSATPAFPHQDIGATRMGEGLDVDGKKIDYWVGNTCYTTPFSLCGSPVAVIPMARSKEGLPIGVQVAGRRWHDMELLAVAEKLSEITGSFQPPPGY